MKDSSSLHSTVNWDARLYEEKHAFIYEYGEALIDLLDPKPGQWILDIGCGTGQITNKLREIGANVIGIDSSKSMIDKARSNFPGLEFLVEDARTYRTNKKFDAVFSNAALHWIKEANEVAITIFDSLKPGGRIVAEMGGHGNVYNIRSALKTVLTESDVSSIDEPWYFPTISQYTNYLENAGLQVDMAMLFARPTRLDGKAGMRKWLEQFAGDYLVSISQEKHNQILEQVVDKLNATSYKDESWWADYKRLRFLAHKPDLCDS